MPYRLPDLRNQKKAITPDAMLANLKRDFELKFSVGIWCFTPGGGRFHDRFVSRGVHPRAHRDGGRHGQAGRHRHRGALSGRGQRGQRRTCTRSSKRDAGIKLVGIPFSHFFDKMFEFGSLSNPDAAVRKKAKEIAVRGLKLVRELGAGAAISWPGMDGYRYLHGKPFMKMWNLFESSMAEAMDEVPGVRIAIEPKGYEPAPNNIYRTTAEGILAAAAGRETC